VRGKGRIPATFFRVRGKRSSWARRKRKGGKASSNRGNLREEAEKIKKKHRLLTNEETYSGKKGGKEAVEENKDTIQCPKGTQECDTRGKSLNKEL